MPASLQPAWITIFKYSTFLARKYEDGRCQPHPRSSDISSRSRVDARFAPFPRQVASTYCFMKTGETIRDSRISVDRFLGSPLYNCNNLLYRVRWIRCTEVYWPPKDANFKYFEECVAAPRRYNGLTMIFDSHARDTWHGYPWNTKSSVCNYNAVQRSVVFFQHTGVFENISAPAGIAEPIGRYTWRRSTFPLPVSPSLAEREKF